MASTHNLSAEKLFSVKDWVCLVTGGGTGIGLMAAQVLAANGAKVYITGRRQEALERAAAQHHPGQVGGEIIPCGPCDVTKKADLEKLYEEIAAKEKYLNLLGKCTVNRLFFFNFDQINSLRCRYCGRKGRA